MAVGDFDNNYGNTPWPDITTNNRTMFERELLRQFFQERMIYNSFVRSQFDLREPRTNRITITTPIMPHVSTDSVGLQTMWIPSSRIDSKSRDITTLRYFDKLAYDKYSDYVSYWTKGGAPGLRNIVRGALGEMMMRKLELLARNAYLGHALPYYAGGATGFDQLDSSDVLTTTDLQNIWLGMSYRGAVQGTSPNTAGKTIFCITSPGVMTTIKEDSDFIDAVKYSRPEFLLNNEVGQWHGIRFLETPDATLFNVGTITTQTSISAAVTQGSGSPAPASAVDGVYGVGQPSGVTNYIQLTSNSGFSVGDFVTIHTDRVSTYGVTNGVDYLDGTAQHRRVVSVLASNRIALNEPIMTDDFGTDLGGGVYGYVTKARHVNTAVFVGGDMSVVLGVTQPPQLHILNPIDDAEMMYRFSWDGYLAYQPFTPEVFEVWYGAAPFRLYNSRVS